jgi:predicted AAA+ superfamily ATPase
MRQTDPAGERSIYLSLDNLYFTTHTLRDTVNTLLLRRFDTFYLDEVHKYPDWSREVKNLYDDEPEIRIILTGSSIIELDKQDVDLSRRIVLYDLSGFSFREYLHFEGVLRQDPIPLEDLFERHEGISLALDQELLLQPHWVAYLRQGYYPYYRENPSLYLERVRRSALTTLHTDIPSAEGARIRNLRGMEKLLQVIAESVPFKPNVSKLAERIGINRATLERYLYYLAQAKLITALENAGKGISTLPKPDKIYLENPNLLYALSQREPEIGNIRETAFASQVLPDYTLTLPKQGDFLIDGTWTVEVGGPSKDFRQIKGLSAGYIAADELRIGVGKKIPLWLFGFLR